MMSVRRPRCARHRFLAKVISYAAWLSSPRTDGSVRAPPRGVLRTSIDSRIEDMGPLNRKRMETIDDETTNAAMDFVERQVSVNKPFFPWMNTTRMHFFTHVRPSMQGQSGMPGNEYADGMIEHDGHVGQLLRGFQELIMAKAEPIDTPCWLMMIARSEESLTS